MTGATNTYDTKLYKVRLSGAPERHMTVRQIVNLFVFVNAAAPVVTRYINIISEIIFIKASIVRGHEYDWHLKTMIYLSK